jgi:hypothetical protein
MIMSDKDRDYYLKCVEAGAIEPTFIDDPLRPFGPKILNPKRGQPTGQPFPSPDLDIEDNYDYDPFTGLFTTDEGYQRYALMIFQKYGVRPPGLILPAEHQKGA